MTTSNMGRREQRSPKRRSISNRLALAESLTAACLLVILMINDYSSPIVTRVSASSITTQIQDQHRLQSEDLATSNGNKQQIGEQQRQESEVKSASKQVEQDVASNPTVEFGSEKPSAESPEAAAAIQRKARAEGSALGDAASKLEEKKDSSSSTVAAAATTPASSVKKSPSGGAAAAKQAASKSSASAGASSGKQATGSSSKPPRLQANLGSTSSQANPSHYMSKNDAYSAIAEKHGAMASAHDAIRRSDKRRIGSPNSFSPVGIQKASGLGDMFNPIKQMTDGGLARSKYNSGSLQSAPKSLNEQLTNQLTRTQFILHPIAALGASMRSMIKGKYSVPAYVASALLGAVALMAFYESPISPLPVPPLPEAPAGRFPPEMPNLPPGTQVPFRWTGNNQQQQQQNYNQRSYANFAQPQQQVLFPNQQAAQQRTSQIEASPSSSAGSMAGQLANNLLSVAKPSQVAQRKSGPDGEPLGAKALLNPIVKSASFLNPASAMKLSSGSNQSLSPKSSSGSSSSGASPSSSGSSLLSYFGLGGQAAVGSSGAAVSDSTGPQRSMGSPEGKGSIQQASSSMGSSLVSKFKSYFSGSAKAPGNADQFSRIGFVQAMMKDASLSLPRFLTPTSRKSSSSSSSVNPSSAAQTVGSPVISHHPNNMPAHSAINPVSAQSMANLYNGLGGGQPLMASSRMQVSGTEGSLGQSTRSKSNAGSGFKLMRVAHALLDTFTNGIAQRSGDSSKPNSQDSQGSSSFLDQSSLGVSPIQMASSLVSDFIANYPTASSQYSSQATHSENSGSSQEQAPSSGSATSKDSANTNSQQLARSNEATADLVSVAHDDSQQQPHSAGNIMSTNNNMQQSAGQPQAGAQVSGSSKSQQGAQASPAQTQPQSSAASEGAHQQSPTSSASVAPSTGTLIVRKTRSIGIDYPNSQVEPIQRSQPQTLTNPSRAAQINAIVDYVADSYTQNKLFINFVMNHVGLSQAVPYVEQILASGSSENNQ